MTGVSSQDRLFEEQVPVSRAPGRSDFAAFDPLAHKSTRASDAAFDALKREISNILSSYVGWYDPFAELIQNALDAVDARMELETSTGTAADYKPHVHVLVDIASNSLTAPTTVLVWMKRSSSSSWRRTSLSSQATRVDIRELAPHMSRTASTTCV